jgi:hypothetical protein
MASKRLREDRQRAQINRLTERASREITEATSMLRTLAGELDAIVPGDDELDPEGLRQAAIGVGAMAFRVMLATLTIRALGERFALSADLLQGARE